MPHTFRSALLFLATGLIGVLLSLHSMTQTMYGPVEQLAVGLKLLISGGFLILGILRVKDEHARAERSDSIPAVILLTVGIATALGGVFLFEPWRSDHTQGFRAFLAGGWALVGFGLALLGEWWRRKQNYQYPLAVLSTVFLLSLFYALFEAFDPLIPNLPYPALLLIGVIAGIPGGWIIYRSTRRPALR